MKKHNRADILIAEHVLGVQDKKARTCIDEVLKSSPASLGRYLEWSAVFDAIPQQDIKTPKDPDDLFDRIERQIDEEDQDLKLLEEQDARRGLPI